MRKAGFILVVIMTLHSCGKEAAKVNFRIITSGFTLESEIYDSIENQDSFSHKFSGGLVTFSDESEILAYDLGSTNIEEYQFELAPGKYLLEVNSPLASLYGQEGASFASRPLSIEITEETDTIFLPVLADCALFLVSDKQKQLEQGIYMIKRHAYANGYFTSTPLFMDAASGLHYTYFTPDTSLLDQTAYLWFYEGAPGDTEGGLSTSGCKVGYQYVIKVLD